MVRPGAWSVGGALVYGGGHDEPTMWHVPVFLPQAASSYTTTYMTLGMSTSVVSYPQIWAAQAIEAKQGVIEMQRRIDRMMGT